MSNSSSCDCSVNNDNGVTASQSPVGILVLQVEDFYQRASLLHPVAVGTIAILVLFVYLRLSSNRCVAPVTLFDWILNVALGSTLAGIVNGTSLARGMLSLAVILLFQLLASQAASHYGPFLEHTINAKPLLIAFRGRMLTKVMRKHRISQSDIWGSLRAEKIWSIRQVEAMIIEANGNFTVYQRGSCPEGMDAEVLMDVPAYRRLVEDTERDVEKGRGEEMEPQSARPGEGKELRRDQVEAANETANEES